MIRGQYLSRLKNPSRLFRSVQSCLTAFMISLAITSVLLSISLFLLRDEEKLSKARQKLSLSMQTDEDGQTCEMTDSQVKWSKKHVAVPEITNESLIIKRSVLLHRDGAMFLKILLLKHCQTNVTDLRLQIDFNQTLCPVVRHIESEECPWEWASGCFWSSFMVTARLNFIPNFVHLSFNGHSIPLHMEPSHYIENIEFAVCIQPVYWFIDWLKIIEFIEIWISQGASHFFFYIYSVSKPVMDILQYYETRGLLIVIPWKPFPKGKYVNPNDEVYRLAHSLANNDCLWRSQGAIFTAFVDLDEYIIALDGRRLIEYMKEKARQCPLCGSFSVIHRKMYYSSPRPHNKFSWRSVGFDWLKDVSYDSWDQNAPRKQIVRPRTVSVISTHSTRKSYRNFIAVKLNPSKIALLHASDKWSNKIPVITDTKTNIFSKSLPSIYRTYEDIGKMIWNYKAPKIDSYLKAEIAQCISRWYERRCKLIDSCKTESVDRVKWIHAEYLSGENFQII